MKVISICVIGITLGVNKLMSSVCSKFELKAQKYFSMNLTTGVLCSCTKSRGRIYIAHMRNIQESAGSRQLDR